MMFCSYITFAGQAQTTGIKKTIVLTSGTATLIDGSCTLSYTIDASIKDVCISFAPIGKDLDLFIEKKDEGAIIIKCTSDREGQFDYVIFGKKELVVARNSKEP